MIHYGIREGGGGGGGAFQYHKWHFIVISQKSLRFVAWLCSQIWHPCIPVAEDAVNFQCDKFILTPNHVAWKYPDFIWCLIQHIATYIDTTIPILLWYMYTMCTVNMRPVLLAPDIGKLNGNSLGLHHGICQIGIQSLVMWKWGIKPCDCHCVWGKLS